ncbi:MAG: hypothetical protein U0998_00270 [Moraxellaceae bacterium]|nr:hypothetical protein [Moraxellaceae bacterium]MDZ4385636.1 hypothetical protein [Moraxellaceae bacterium]
MKIANHTALIAGLLLATQSAFAHDPALHAAEAAAAKAGPDCAAMTKMDMSKMDMNDPVMKAMHMKCMPTKKPADNKAAPMDHSKMQGMDHSKSPDFGEPVRRNPYGSPAQKPTSAPESMPDMPGMDHSGHGG